MAAHDDIAWIRQLMHDAQRVVEDNGKYFIAWGLLTVLGLAFTYAAVVIPLDGRLIWGAWAALVIGGWVYSGLAARRYHQRARTRSVAGRLVGDIWAGVGLASMVAIFGGGLSGALPTAALPGLAAAVIGAGFFASALVYPAVPLRAVGVLWWVGALVMFVWRGPHTLLLMAGLVLVLEVGPGVWLWRQARRGAAERA